MFPTFKLLFSKFKPRRKTPEETENRRRFWRKARRGIGWTLAALFVAHCALNIYASVLLNRELAAIRQKGEPLQFSELAPPSVPDSQNAALVYKAAYDSLRFSDEEKESFRAREGNRSPQQKRWVEEAVAKNQKAIELTRRAAAMTRCVFPLNYNIRNPFELLFPHFGEMRELARLLNAQAQLEAKAGNEKEALRDVRAVFSMANHLSNEPSLIGFLVAQAVESIADTTLAQVLSNISMSSTQAREFKKSLPQTDWNRTFERALMGERAAGISMFELLRQPDGISIAQINSFTGGAEGDGTGGILWPSWGYAPLILAWRPVSKLDEVHSLRLWKAQLSAAASPQTSAFSNINQSFEKAVSELPNYAILTRILMPVYSRTSSNRDRAEVRRRQREIALALAVYRGEKGHYPQKMEELDVLWGKALPFDPCSNKPFIYRRDGESFLLYSIGPNLKDERGEDWRTSPLPPGELNQRDDISWGDPKPGIQ